MKMKKEAAIGIETLQGYCRWGRRSGVVLGVMCLMGCALSPKDVSTSAPMSSTAVNASLNGHRNTPGTEVHQVHSVAEEAIPAGSGRQLATCLFEARQLAQLGGAYRSQVAELYRHLQAAKYYASIAGELSGGTTDTITPLYQYRVNDVCNAVSQSLLAELKKGVMPGRGAQ